MLTIYLVTSYVIANGVECCWISSFSASSRSQIVRKKAKRGEYIARSTVVRIWQKEKDTSKVEHIIAAKQPTAVRTRHCNDSFGARMRDGNNRTEQQNKLTIKTPTPPPRGEVLATT